MRPPADEQLTLGCDREAWRALGNSARISIDKRSKPRAYEIIDTENIAVREDRRPRAPSFTISQVTVNIGILVK